MSDYEKPELRRFGSFRELTESGWFSVLEGPAGIFQGVFGGSDGGGGPYGGGNSDPGSTGIS